MWCIIRIGSQQFKVSKDDVIEVERISNAADDITIEDVLLFSDGKKLEVGKPVLSGVSVKAKIQKEYKTDKVYAFKFRRRKNSKSLRGHRQAKLSLKITDIIHS